MPVDWTPLVALALSSQVVGQGLLIWALPRFSPLVIGLTLLVQHAIAALAGWLMFGERLGAIDLAGGLMVGAALGLIRLPSRRQRTICCTWPRHTSAERSDGKYCVSTLSSRTRPRPSKKNKR